MTQYTPKKFNTKLNYSQEHPLKEFLSFVAKGICLLFTLYFTVDLTLDFFITRLSVEKEVWIWNKIHLAKAFDPDESLKIQQDYVETVFSKIPDDVKPEGYHFFVVVKENKQPNAYALPGGGIVVTTALLDFLDSENALTFILGHELGHFKNRDHLRGMGFGLAASALMLAIAGQDPAVVKAASGMLNIGSLSYSRAQETKADQTGLTTLETVYGYTNGATEFFEKLQMQRSNILKNLEPFLSTHPTDQKRIDMIERATGKTNHQEKITPLKKF